MLDLIVGGVIFVVWLLWLFYRDEPRNCPNCRMDLGDGLYCGKCNVEWYPEEFL